MRKPDDPEMLAAREERDAARLALMILCKGFGGMFSDCGERDPEGVQDLIDKVNADLKAVVDRSLAAELAYEPYWRRRRTRRVTVQSKAKKKKVVN